MDAALAFVEAGPAAGAFVFAAGGGAGAGLAADGTVAACGEGIHREVAEEILQLLCDDLSRYTPLVPSDCLDSGPKNCLFPSIWLGWVFVKICSKATVDHKRTYSLFGVSVTKRMSLLNYQFFIRIVS